MTTVVSIGTTLGCEDRGLHDNSETIKLLEEIGAVTERDLQLVKEVGDGHVKSLDLMGKDISRVLPHLHGLKKLEALEVNVGRYQLEEMESIGELTTLKHLTIGCTENQLPVLRELRNLTKLQACGNGISDDGLRHFASMKKMKVLRLDGNPFTGSGLRHLTDFSECEELSVIDTHLEDEAIPHIVKNFPKLKKIDFDRTNVTPEGIMQLADLHWLVSLGYPNDLFGADKVVKSREERIRLIAEKRAAKKELSVRFLEALTKSKRAARLRGEKVPPDDYHPFGGLLTIDDIELEEKEDDSEAEKP